ncbi:UNVERIFIED_ORG: redox-sensitive bicupin YhaK (pirin superfamily) [Xanthobacter viscosus]|uniref:Pirin family protein n=1 Tax=Xanthobacter autotrophicus TaxID=280 RepID=A0A6C1KDU6_XANAU|nr:pirin family protein [Xanthobacter autotrophicus]TLX41414.1 pirin family protein [Xanthobacter autotrophicus]
MTPVKLDRSVKRTHRTGDFGIEILFPGMTLGQGDSGIGAIGRIDQALIGPGGFVALHPHRDDEILTYMRGGTMLHRDTVGNEEVLTKTRLMLMNAGHTFQHEEKMVGTEDIEALQIFIRPRAPALEPMVQFHDFPDAISQDEWRLIAGPKGEAPLELRAAAWVQDSHLSAGAKLALPAVPVPGAMRLLYVFAGRASVGTKALCDGESLVLDDEAYVVEAQADTDLVLFTTDASVPVFKGGMFSGNVLAR